MPSRNAPNTPKLSGKGPKRPSVIKTPRMASGESTKSAGKVTSKAISKKRAKKDLRNAKYTADNRSRAIEEQLEAEGIVSMQDNGRLTSTQKKIRERRLQAEKHNAIKLNVLSDLPPEELQLTSSGTGTTLGRPPVKN